jgi:hypothetical protein
MNRLTAGANRSRVKAWLMTQPILFVVPLRSASGVTGRRVIAASARRPLREEVA